MMPFQNFVTCRFPHLVFQQCGVGLLAIALLTSCGQSSKEAPQVEKPDWTGSANDFLQAFVVEEGRFQQSSSGQLYTGKIHLTPSPPHPAYNITLFEGTPIQWKESSSGKSLLRWHQPGLWIGNDIAWEEDFEETANGLLHRPTNQPFHGKLFSINEQTGSLEAEYTYAQGIPHGSEIYYDDQHKEARRVNWVNGKIPLQKF